MSHEAHSGLQADLAGGAGVVGEVCLVLDVDGGARADHDVADGANHEAVAAETLAPSAAENEAVG